MGDHLGDKIRQCVISPGGLLFQVHLLLLGEQQGHRKYPIDNTSGSYHEETPLNLYKIETKQQSTQVRLANFRPILRHNILENKPNDNHHQNCSSQNTDTVHGVPED